MTERECYIPDKGHIHEITVCELIPSICSIILHAGSSLSLSIRTVVPTHNTQHTTHNTQQCQTETNSLDRTHVEMDIEMCKV